MGRRCSTLGADGDAADRCGERAGAAGRGVIARRHRGRAGAVGDGRGIGRSAGPPGRWRPRWTRQPADERSRHHPARARHRDQLRCRPCRPALVGDGLRRLAEQPGPADRGRAAAAGPRLRVRRTSRPGGADGGRLAHLGPGSPRRRAAPGAGARRRRHVERRRVRSRRGSAHGSTRTTRRRSSSTSTTSRRRWCSPTSSASTASSTSPPTGGSRARRSERSPADHPGCGCRRGWRSRLPTSAGASSAVRFRRASVRTPAILGSSPATAFAPPGGVPTTTNEQAYVEGTEAKWWTMLTPKRKQELSLAAMSLVSLAALVTLVLTIRRARSRLKSS